MLLTFWSLWRVYFSLIRRYCVLALYLYVIEAIIASNSLCNVFIFCKIHFRAQRLYTLPTWGNEWTQYSYQRGTKNITFDGFCFAQTTFVRTVRLVSVLRNDLRHTKYWLIIEYRRELVGWVFRERDLPTGFYSLASTTTMLTCPSSVKMHENILHPTLRFIIFRLSIIYVLLFDNMSSYDLTLRGHGTWNSC
jgi:hypothetical protein